MDFQHDERVTELTTQLWSFMHERVFPVEQKFGEQVAADRDHWGQPPLMADLIAEARARGLWNLFLPDARFGAGLSVTQYAPLAEITGWSPLIAPEALNCAAPDTGNMELLTLFGTPEQQQTWLEPLLDARIRSCFSMTEPDTASSDADNVNMSITRDGDDLVLNGRKWWSTGAMRDECAVALVMGVTDPDAQRGRRHSIVIVPTDTPGLQRVRSTSVFGFTDRQEGGHAELLFDDVRVPVTHLLGDQGSGFAMAQARLGPGRIHHCMRLLGMAERALDSMCSRVTQRSTFGSLLSEHGVVQEWIAESRIRIEAARALVYRAAWLMDTAGGSAARTEIAAIKVLVPGTTRYVVDRAIQAFGGAGLSQDTPLAMLYTQARFLQIADGPDEVHRRSIARSELRRARTMDGSTSSITSVGPR